MQLNSRLDRRRKSELKERRGKPLEKEIRNLNSKESLNCKKDKELKKYFNKKSNDDLNKRQHFAKGFKKADFKKNNKREKKYYKKNIKSDNNQQNV